MRCCVSNAWWASVMLLAPLALAGCAGEGGSSEPRVLEVSADSVVLQLDAAPRAGTAAMADKRPDDERGRMLRAVDRLQYAHEFAAAEQRLDQWLRTHGTDAELLLQRAQLRLHQNRGREALADCVRATPGLAALTAAACQAQALAALGQIAMARAMIERALATAQTRGSEYVWALGIAAEIAERAGDLAVAEAGYRRALSLAGDAHYPRVAYADFLARQGRRGGT